MKSLHPTLIVNFLTDKLNLYGFRVRLSSAVLSKKAQKCANPREYVNLVSEIFLHPPLKYIGWSIKPLQVKQEIEALLSLLEQRNIKSILEIGTANGGTLFLFTRIVDPNAKIISLDLPAGKFGGGYEKTKVPFFTNFAQKNQRIHLLRADSHSPISLSAVMSILQGQKLDFLFIDGDHTYEGVKADFQMYSPLVCKGGIIAFHDICKGPSEAAGGVYGFWNEIKRAYLHKEFVHALNQEGFGIGLLFT